MKHPIFLDLRGRSVVVLGGGPVAERKVESLLIADARVKVVSPAITERIRRWAETGRLALERRAYETGDLTNAAIAYAAFGDDQAIAAVRREADARGVWLNVADRPELCDFFAPAVARRGRLAIAVSTDGASPLLAARLCEKFDRELPPEVEGLVEQLAELRDACRREGRPLSGARGQIERLIDGVLGGRTEGRR